MTGFCRAVFGAAAAGCGISAAKVPTVVTIRLTAAVMRAERAASLMWAALSKAGRF
jgi:hypothetical protein